MKNYDEFEGMEHFALFEDVYESLLGLREPEAQVPWVNSAFEEDMECALAYEEMRQAYERVCDRLGIGSEDEDLNIMVESMEQIQKALCFEMLLLANQYDIGYNQI